MKVRMLKRFGLALLLAGLILVCLGIGFSLRLQMELHLVTTYVASHDLPPRTLVTEEDLLEIEVPQAYLQGYTYNRKEDIIGKYTDLQGRIPAGSCFYFGMLKKAEDLPDYPTTLLLEGQSAYSLETDLARCGGTLQPAQRADVFVTLQTEQETLTGCLFRHARILAVKDHNGLDLQAEDSSGIPYLVILAIPSQEVAVLARAEAQGEVRLIASSETYDAQKEAVPVTDGEVYRLLSGS